MSSFETLIINAWAKKGKKWLAQLPEEVKKWENCWGLSQLQPFPNLTHHYVLRGFRDKVPIVLKLGPDPLSLEHEARSLKAFTDYGAVAVIDDRPGALLLERCVPGISLSQHPSSLNGLNIACDVAKRLHQAPLPSKGDFSHISDWLNILDSPSKLPQPHQSTARKLKKHLLEKTAPSVLLHGDLHRGNILSQGNEWRVIDPKGLIGPPVHEIWAFIEDADTELKSAAYAFQLSFDEVAQWYYIHLVLAARWGLEHGLDAARFLTLAEAALLRF